MELLALTTFNHNLGIGPDWRKMMKNRLMKEDPRSISYSYWQVMLMPAQEVTVYTTFLKRHLAKYKNTN